MRNRKKTSPAQEIVDDWFSALESKEFIISYVERRLEAPEGPKFLFGDIETEYNVQTQKLDREMKIATMTITELEAELDWIEENYFVKLASVGAWE
jgi:hypothetical protein